MRRLAQLLALAIALGSMPAAAGEPLPPEWIVFPGVLDQQTRSCANWSRQERSVSTRGGNIEIGGATASTGQTHRTIPFGKGRIALLDEGEWGGNVQYVGPDGPGVILISENGIGGVRIDAGVLVMTGLNHLTLRSGKLWLITGEDGGAPQVRELVDLSEQPEAFATLPDGSVIVATSGKVMSVSRDAAVTTIFESRPPAYFSLYPTSIAQTNTGAIYIGMRHFVVRLTRAGSSIREEWLVPKDCPLFAPTATFGPCPCKPN